MRVEVEGRRDLRAKLVRSAAKVKTNVEKAVAEAGEDLLAKAITVTPLADHLGGELRGTGYVDHQSGEAIVGFSARYAVYVHEMGITVYPERAPIHWTTPGTHAKFLTGPFLENRQRYSDYIKDAARRGLNV